MQSQVGLVIEEQAKIDWKHQNLEVFPKIPNDAKEFVPLPQPKFKRK